MNKKYLMKGFAALALIAGFSSCVKDVEGVDPAKQDAAGKENAELQLGLTIPDGQSWDMSTQITTNVSVNLKSGETYEVAVYANDPIADGVGKVLTKGTVQNGKTFSTKFTGSKGAKYYVIGVTDSKNFTRYTNGIVENGNLVANFGASSSASRSMRAITIGGDTYSTFNFPTSDELEEVFPTEVPSDAEEISELTSLAKYKTQEYNNAEIWWIYFKNGADFNYKVTKTGEATIGGGWKNEESDGTPLTFNVFVDVNGSVTLKRSGTEHMNLYILNGTVTIDGNFGECGGIISVAEGATLIDNRDHVAHNSGIKIFNRGTYNATAYKYDIGNKATFYNEGTFTSKNALSYSPGAGNTSYFINKGDGNDETIDLKAPSMTLNSTCHFYTEGQVEIDGETSVTQSGIVWINNGHYKTGTLKFSASNGTFYNYCQLIVEDVCYYTDGKFNMMTGSYAELNKALFNNFYVEMADNSTIYVKEGTIFGRQGQGTPQGFYAVDNNAQATVLLAGTTKSFTHNGGALHISGAKLSFGYESLTFYNDSYYFTTDSYDNSFGNFHSPTTKEELEANGDGRTTMVVHEGASYSQIDDIEFTAPDAGQCSATIGEGGNEKIEEPAPVTFAFEDQIYAGDYDLNDVVLKITPHVVRSGKKITAIDYDQLDVKLVASGATFKIHAFIGQRDEDGKPVDGAVALFDGKEIHDAFGKYNAASGATQPMINTGNGKAITAEPVTCTIATPANIKSTDADGNTTLDFSQLDIWIWVNKGTGSQSEAVIAYKDEKKWPYAVMIPNDWAWSTERTCVTEAYAGTEDAETISIASGATSAEYKENSFGAWAATEDAQRTTTMKSWFNYPVSGKTMRNQ